MRSRFTIRRKPTREPQAEGLDEEDPGGRLAVRSYEAGRITTLGQSTIEAMARRGEVPCVRVGRAVLFPVSALQEWLHAQAMAGLGKRSETDDEQAEADEEGAD